MKKRYKIVGCAAVIVVLICCGIVGYLNKQQQDSGEFSGIRIPAVQEDDKEQPALQIPVVQEDDKEQSALQTPVEQQTDREQSALQIPTERENDKATEIRELGDIKSAVVFEDETHVVLDEEGLVWQWQEGETKKDAQVILDTEKIVKIISLGTVVYALTENGDVYAWGKDFVSMINPDDEMWIYPEPVKLEGVSDIVCMDAGFNEAFAIDSAGRLYAWGLNLGRGSDSKQSCTPQPFEEYEDRIGKVEEVYVGGGDCYYFKRADGSFFSITEFHSHASSEGKYIFPNFPGREPVTDIHNSSAISEMQGEEGRIALLYEMGKNDDVKLLAADRYTLYLYLRDNTLWYWNSDRITYHNKEAAGASAEKKAFDHSGYFEKVDLNEVMGMEGDTPEIIQIYPSKDGALFLLENGEVIGSEYVTTKEKDVEYYAFDDYIYTPGSSENTAVVYQMRLKELAFQKLEYENIVDITGDKLGAAYLLDEEENIYVYGFPGDFQD